MPRDDRGGERKFQSRDDRGDRRGYQSRDDRGGSGERRFGSRDDRGDRGGSRPYQDRRDDRGGERKFGSRDDRPGNRDRKFDRKDRAPRGADGPRSESDAPRLPEPELPEGIEAADLDSEVRADLRSLPKGAAESIAKHLVAAGQLIDEDPEKALEHARYARSKAGRVALVREAAGLAAYHAGEWAEAIAELRASRRMGGGPGHLAILADCERALGRPERALEFARSPEAAQLTPDQAVELRIVIAGARRDLGQLDASVVALQGSDLDAKRRDPWSARLFYAYADNLAAAGRTEEAVQWFINAAEADVEEETDASDRASELSGGERTTFEAVHISPAPAKPAPAETEEAEAEKAVPDETEADKADEKADEPEPVAEQEKQETADAPAVPAFVAATEVVEPETEAKDESAAVPTFVQPDEKKSEKDDNAS
ncbi:hypothetical protein [Allokutzneria oryzae]|uniref:Tetratricopeptide repeat protein n=1 Tax=Allokutzneria oryzae TaxID=1378989 RepID=A0ABV6A575_9PSEU